MQDFFDGLVVRIPFLHRSATARQFVKFSLVGVTNTFWDFFLYILLTRGWLGFTLHFLLANLLAFLASVVNSYILNRRWTFRSTDPRRRTQFSKFLVVNAITLLLYETLFYFLHTELELFDLLAKSLSVVVVLVWNFTANKYWTFREHEGTSALQKAL